ncbi:MAG: LamG-like jellyroll fold domain-containing protein [Verrucomicrobiales bacterium]
MLKNTPVRATGLGVGIALLFGSPLMAGNYQNAVRKLQPSFYYELNETSTDGGAVDSTGHAAAPGEFNGDYGNGPEVGGPGPLVVFNPDDIDGTPVPGVGGESNLAHYSNNEGHITLGDGELYAANTMSVALFLKAGPAQGGDRVFTNNIEDPALSFQIVTANDGLVLAVDPNNSGEEAERTLFLEDNSGPDRRLIDPDSGWFHVIATVDGTTAAERAASFRLWINGVDRTENLQPNVTGWGIDTGLAKIGGRRDDPLDSTTHSGAQDEVAIWLNHALTDAEAESLWAAATNGNTSLPPFAAVWQFDGDANDSSGNGNNGELVDAEFSTDVPRNAGGKSLQISEGAHVLVEHAESLNITDAITIAAWVKPVGETGWDGIIAKNPSDGSASNHAGNYELRIENGARYLNFLYQQGGSDDTTSQQALESVIDPDVWSHVAVTADTASGDVNFYINGELSQTFEGILPVEEFPTNEGSLYIGSRADLFTPFDGFLDEVVLASSALTADQIALLYTAGIPRNAGEVTIESLGLGTESLIGGDLTDPEDDGDETAGADDPSWNWVSIDADDEPYFDGGEGAFNVFDNKLGGGDDKWCCTDATEDSPRHITVEFAEAIRLEYFTISSANDTPARDPIIWEIQGSNSAIDAEDFETIYRYEDDVAIWTERLEVVKFTLGIPSKPFKFIRYIAFDTPDPLHQLAEIEYFGAPGALDDFDGDGMSDDFEAASGLDPRDASDAALDKDGDGLTNLQEYTKRTDVNKVDTDGDGLSDGVETDTGVWVSATDTGTSPLKADSDRDKLSDGVETNTKVFASATDTGTDPNKKDTDGDGAGDGIEVAGGTNPLDPTSVASAIRGGGVFTVTHVWTEGDPQINDPLTAEEVTADDSEVGQRLTIESPFINFDDNSVAPVFGDQAVPFPLWGPEGDDSGLSDRDDFAIRAVGQVNITQGGLISFICNSDDGFILRIDGEEVGQAGNRGRGNSLMEVELAAGLHDLEFIYYERGGGAGVTLYVYRGTDAAPALNADDWELLGASGGGSVPFRISDVVLEGDTLTVSWPSRDGESFTIEIAPDLQDWEEVTDGHASQGAVTSYELTLDAPRPSTLYVRVTKEE